MNHERPINRVNFEIRHLTLLGRGGGLNQTALFLIYYEPLEKQNKFFWFFTVFLGDLEGAGWFSPPTLKQHPEAPPY